MLRGLASLIHDNLRSSDQLGRYGGEEFAIVLPEADLQGAVALAEKIRGLVEDFVFDSEGQTIRVTISAGVTAFEPNTTVKELIARADEKLYVAKDGVETGWWASARGRWLRTPSGRSRAAPLPASPWPPP